MLIANPSLVISLLASLIRLAWSIPTSPLPNLLPQYHPEIDNGSVGYYPIRTYTSAPGITSPDTNFLQWSEQCEDGRLYMLTPRGDSLTNPGPMILDAHGELIWAGHFDNEFGGQAYNLMMQTYHGEDYLTFWLGDDRLNSSYDVIHKLDAAHGQSADLHEFVITPEGTALLTAYQVIPRDLTAFWTFDLSSPDDQDPHYIWDCLFQEVEIDSGELLFEWRASDHVPLNHSYHSIGTAGTQDDPFDWFHINSVEKDTLGNYLISARYTHSIIYINGSTSEIIWTLGGLANDFADLNGGSAISFAWQHDVRIHPLDMFPRIYNPPESQPGIARLLLTMFDNAAADQDYEYGSAFSRGLLLEATYPTSPFQAPRRQIPVSPSLVDSISNTADARKIVETNGTNPDYNVRVIKIWKNPQGVRASSQGAVQVLAPTTSHDAKVLVGYGLNAVFTEFDSNGTVLCDAHFGAKTSWERGDVQSYRAYKFPWTGAPRTPPNLVLSADNTQALISWNGATEVSEWVLQSSERNSGLERAWQNITRRSACGFETSLPIPRRSVAHARQLRVIALDASGQHLPYGTSLPVRRDLVTLYLALVHDRFLAHLTRFLSLLVPQYVLAFLVVLYLEYALYRWSRRCVLRRRVQRQQAAAGLLWHEQA
nr:hypothetical protein CFP56_28810 [Quercus suber]